MARDRGYEQVAHLYDLFDTKANIPFFGHYAARVDEILDVGAGTGRIAIPMAQKGTRVVCVEPSPAMRAELRRKLEAQPALGARICLVAADAASFQLGRELPAAFMSGSFDHLLSPTERFVSLRNIARHLLPGATLVFDVFVGLMRDRPLSAAGQVTAGGRDYRRFVATQVLPDHTIEVRLLYEV